MRKRDKGKTMAMKKTMKKRHRLKGMRNGDKGNWQNIGKAKSDGSEPPIKI